MLPYSDWLAQAQRLSVGMTLRVRHNRERRANMIIGNERGRWWAYCQACKQGGVLQKEHVLLQGPAEPLEGAVALSPPRDLVLVQGSDFEAAVHGFLARKGMDACMLPKLYVSPAQRRMCLQDDGAGWHGRDLTERSDAKWLHYGKPHVVGHVGLTTIITEDLFSMYKVRWALRGTNKPYCVATTLGAGCGAGAALALKDCRRIVWAYDGDKAGDQGYASASKRMRAFGSKQFRARPPDGLDPKDMDCADIRAMIQGALECSA